MSGICFRYLREVLRYMYHWKSNPAAIMAQLEKPSLSKRARQGRETASLTSLRRRHFSRGSCAREQIQYT